MYIFLFSYFTSFTDHFVKFWVANKLSMRSLTWCLYRSVICSECHVLMFTWKHAKFYCSYFLWALYVSLSSYLMIIVKFNIFPVRLHDIKQRWNWTKDVSFFTSKIWRNFSITSQLRLGPFLRDAAHFVFYKYKNIWFKSRCIMNESF